MEYGEIAEDLKKSARSPAEGCGGVLVKGYGWTTGEGEISPSLFLRTGKKRRKASERGGGGGEVRGFGDVWKPYGYLHPRGALGCR